MWLALRFSQQNQLVANLAAQIVHCPTERMFSVATSLHSASVTS